MGFGRLTASHLGPAVSPPSPHSTRWQVVLLERGQPVEVRGKDIGALFVRRRVNPESNLCYGEGGAGEKAVGTGRVPACRAHAAWRCIS